ncbi:glycosyltransferase [Phocaeicola sp.]
MKKILHVAEPFATGVLSFLIDITKRQVEEYEVYILYGIRPLTPENVEQLFDKRVHLIKIDSFKGAIGTVVNLRAYYDVYKWYKEIKPDIVHFHSSASGFIGRWTLPCKKIPAFYTPHGYSFLMKDGAMFKRFLFWLIEYLSAKRSCMTIACSEGEYKEAKKLSPNSTYVNNGINTAELKTFVRPINGIVKQPIQICTSGRILYQKNPRLFNEIAQLLPEAQFIWIGEGELKNELTSSNISVTGWIKREEALDIIKDVDFFILPSLWEGLPISLLEAMYLKKICLVSNVIGNRDVIRNGVNGLICNSANEYADSIRDIVNGKIDGISLSECASENVEQNYNVDLMAQKYDKIYNKGSNLQNHS